jgi:GT2 family glycosyltransferase
VDINKVSASLQDFVGGFGSGNILYRKEIFFQCGGFDENYWIPGNKVHFREDTDLGLRMSKFGEVFLFSSLEAYHPCHGCSKWFVLKDALKYSLEPYFLKRNPDAKLWIGSWNKPGRLGTRQTRGMLSIFIIFITLVSFFVPQLVYFLVLLIALVGVLVFRRYKLSTCSLYLMPILALAYPYVHGFSYLYGWFFLSRRSPRYIENGVSQ